MTDLGFGKKLLAITPDTSPSEPSDTTQIDRLAEQHGFTSREPTQKIIRRKDAEPSANLNIRPPISTYNRFLTFAIENNLSYPAALKELMDRAKV
ncbi:hypothetical protein [Agrobacterium sp. LAD9]|uniref:hypothetical protein n=1 Tax=Agrobacterium sp. LAD9 TaxID=2055153 RepID=UPI000D1D8A96|nr:hypothetical protein [Agrobacterium sp. LAD9]